MSDHNHKAAVGACVLSVLMMLFAGPLLFVLASRAVLAVAGCGHAACPPAVARLSTFAGVLAVFVAAVGLARFLYRTARRDA